jgi:hypothetical protein
MTQMYAGGNGYGIPPQGGDNVMYGQMMGMPPEQMAPKMTGKRKPDTGIEFILNNNPPQPPY